MITHPLRPRLQPRQRRRIANIYPPALNLQPGYFVPGRQQPVHRVRQLILAAGRFFQLRRELEQRWFEYVNPGIIPNGLVGFKPAFAPQLVQLLMRRFLHQAFEAELVVKKVQTAFGNVLAARHRDHAGKRAFLKTANHLLIGLRFHQNIAIRHDELRIANKVPGHFRGLAGAVLNKLPAERQARLPFRAVAKVTLDHFRAIAGDDKHVVDTRREDTFQDVLQNGLALHLEHRLGQLLGEFLHPGAFACGQKYCFHLRSAEFIPQQHSTSTVAAE